MTPLGLAGKGRDGETAASGEWGKPAARTSPALKTNPKMQSEENNGTFQKDLYRSNQLIFLIFYSDFQG